MSRYRKVDLRIWGDERVRRLSAPKPNGRDCWLYLLTAKETIILPGAIPAGPAALAESLRWSTPGFLAAFAEIEAEGMAIADWDSGLVWIPKAILYNTPDNPNVAKAWAKAFEQLPGCALRERIASDVADFIATRTEPVQKAFHEAFRKGSGTVSKTGAGAGAGAGAGSFFNPQAEVGSGETEVPHNAPVENAPDQQPAEAHWGALAESLVTRLRAERSVAGLDDDSDADLLAIEEWAWDWVRKHEPDKLAVEQLVRAFLDFIGWAMREGNGGSMILWCSPGVWEWRWNEQRAAPRKAPRRAAAAGQREVPHVA